MGVRQEKGVVAGGGRLQGDVIVRRELEDGHGLQIKNSLRQTLSMRGLAMVLGVGFLLGEGEREVNWKGLRCQPRPGNCPTPLLDSHG